MEITNVNFRLWGKWECRSVFTETFVNLDEMFKNTFQSGYLSILYSIGSKPLQVTNMGLKSSKWSYQANIR